MKRAWRLSLTFLLALAVCALCVPQALAAGGGRSLATVTGSVRDDKGNPLAGAVVSLLREGAGEIVKQVKSAADGTFSAKIAPGRYTLRAIASGFNATVFDAVEVKPSEELIYRFNLEPIGQGRTVPEKRADRDSRKWALRAQGSRRSIFQMQEGDSADEIAAAIDEHAAQEDAARADEITSQTVNSETKHDTRVQGVVETFFASSSNQFAPSYGGMNFALQMPATDAVSLILAGQTGIGAGAPQRLEATARVRANDRHKVALSFGGITFGANAKSLTQNATRARLGQFSLRAVDEWVVRDGIVVVMGLDYSRFIGASHARAVSPRLGLQFDANARTRVKAAYAPGMETGGMQSLASFEDGQIVFKQPVTQPIALVDGRAVMERSRRFELGIERVLDEKSSVEATAFFDTTTGRGVGLLNRPLSAFNGESGAALINVANQQGNARGMRVVYTRRIGSIVSASAGYSAGRGQRLSNSGLNNPARIFSNGFFQTAALQASTDLPTGTRVQTVFRFSSRATVFAIDPFAGRLAVYDPSLSIVVTQELPTFGLPVRAQAIIDARNLLDNQTCADDGDILTSVNAARRSVRGGISVRF